MTKRLKGYQITDQYITVNYDGRTHHVARSEALADRLIKALREGRENDIPNLVDSAKRVAKYTKGKFEVRDGKVYVNGVEAPKTLGDKIWRFSNEGLPSEPLVRFAENLQKNPSFRAVNELFQFLEKNNHPITENGCFIAYKKVRNDYKDVHSGTFDNSPGQVVQMPRNKVNENAQQTCSYGLHVANYDYALQFYSGGIMLECEVDPADVVAIPIDYNQSKMRVCKYKVLGVVDQKHSDDLCLRVTNPSYVPAPEPSYDEGEEEDDGFHPCDNCGGECEEGYDVCSDCEDEVYDNEEDEEEEDEEEEDFDDEEEEDEDEYPWHDELED